MMLSGEYIKLESNDFKTLIDGDLLDSFFTIWSKQKKISVTQSLNDVFVSSK